MTTAFVRMMLERGDFVVLHEPFSSVIVQGFTVLDGEHITDLGILADAITKHAATRRVFVKETTEYRYPIWDDPEFLRSGRHTFIVRDPRDVIPSHYEMNPNLQVDEVGFGHLWELYESVTEVAGYLPPVFEAEALARDPGSVVEWYCATVGIPFLPDSLHWSPEDRPEWRRTQRWHQAVARSAGFAPPRSGYAARVDNTALLGRYFELQRPFYERLRAFSEIAGPPLATPLGSTRSSS